MSNFCYLSANDCLSPISASATFFHFLDLLKNTVSSPRKQFRQQDAAAVLQDGPVPARITPSLPIAIAFIRP
jgi:hypothetical protein